MRILVVGSGGREHALCWKLRQSAQESDLYCAPGNYGIGKLADLVPIAPEEIQQLADFATELRIDLTVVGPELPLSLGIVDEFTNRDLKIFGPTQDAARLESSKVFAKEFMVRHGIPTAPFTVIHDGKEGLDAAKRIGFPLVLKADGLASGKGVLVIEDEAALEEAIKVFFDERRFGASGDRVLVEPFLAGEEVSFMALSDGEHVLPLATAKDYKRIGDGDTGLNTGGMGAHTPSGVLAAEDAANVLDHIVRPTIAAMAEEDTPFVGVLYAGLMLTDEGPQVLEFNVRLGDPETQAVLLRLEDDLADLLHAGASGAFGGRRVHFRKGAAACLVLASEGYPSAPKKGAPISGLDAAALDEGVEIFHAGTAELDGGVVTAGGRVLNVCAQGADLRDSLRKAYAAAAKIDWPGKVMRNDIGRRVLERGSQR